MSDQCESGFFYFFTEIGRMTQSWHDRLRQYFDHVANVLDLRKDCKFNQKVTAAHWDDNAKHWKVTSGPDGTSLVTTAQHIIFCLVSLACSPSCWGSSSIELTIITGLRFCSQLAKRTWPWRLQGRSVPQWSMAWWLGCWTIGRKESRCGWLGSFWCAVHARYRASCEWDQSSLRSWRKERLNFTM